MIIRIIASNRAVQIDDPGNFRAFSVRIEGSIDPEVQAELLGRVAVRSDAEHAWSPKRRYANGRRSNPRHGGRTA